LGVKADFPEILAAISALYFQGYPGFGGIAAQLQEFFAGSPTF
jgi:hypothetical protein